MTIQPDLMSESRLTEVQRVGENTEASQAAAHYRRECGTYLACHCYRLDVKSLSCDLRVQANADDGN